MRANKFGVILSLMFVRDWPWKILSLLIAMGIYFSVRAEISNAREITVSVEADTDALAAVPSDFVIESIEPQMAKVSVRGTYSLVNQLNPDLIKFKVNPRMRNDSPTNAVIVPLNILNLQGIERGLRVMRIEPSEVLVKYDWPIVLRLQVAKPELIGKAFGRAEIAAFEQTNVVVKGSQRLLRGLDPRKVLVMPEPIDVTGRTQGFTARVKLCPPVDAMRVTVDPDAIAVDVRVISEE